MPSRVRAGLAGRSRRERGAAFMSITVTNMFVANKFATNAFATNAFATNAFAGRRADALFVER
ncbi:hypothetical protein GCM10010300_41330 [Streptomyces olivaceoviridis]|nr:hypothetical protein GCM10010300_41330 [Streptomyces olivaceoviridis]